MTTLRVCSLNTNAEGVGPYYVYVHPTTTVSGFVQLASGRIYTTVPNAGFAPGTVGMNNLIRIAESLPLNAEINLLTPNLAQQEPLLECKLIVHTVGSVNGPVQVDSDILTAQLKALPPFFLNNGCPFAIQYGDVRLKLVPSFGGVTALFHENVAVQLERGTGSTGANIIIVNQHTSVSLFKEKMFDFSSIKIGGLKDELNTIFRRVFATRILPASIVTKLNINHIKGLILYGPPGTGKTLIARQLSKSLSATSIKIVNGPELINSYVGKSEENVRNLFKEAEEDNRNGTQSLHVIIFDEFDSLCRKRGEGGGDVGGRVNDSIVTQLLSKIDGVDQLNNVILIGMTNRIELLDPAILRPGRFEVHIKIGLPNTDGRREILEIHTADLKRNGCLAPAVNLMEVAQLTENYSGAELEGIVKDARSFAINEHIDFTDMAKRIDIADISVTQEHLLKAVGGYTPAFGTSQQALSYYDGGLGTNTTGNDSLLTNIVDAFGTGTNLYSILCIGDPHTGKTKNSIYVARELKYAFTKVVSANDMIGMSDASKISYISDIFNQAYLCEYACIIVDNLDSILEYHRDTVTGALRFNNTLFQMIKTLVTRRPLHPTNKLVLLINHEPMEGVSIRPYVTAVYEL